MSTEVMNMNREVLLEPFIEIIQDECLDIVDEEKLTAERYAGKIFLLANLIRHSWGEVTDWCTQFGGEIYQIRVNNGMKGFVSVTNEDGDTGVSYTKYKPYYEDSDSEFAGLLNLAQMVNEAWYLSNN